MTRPQIQRSAGFLGVTYHLDLETTSAANLTKVGAARYAIDPSTRILMYAIATEGVEPLVWDSRRRDSSQSCEAVKMLHDAIITGAEIYAHNYQFESEVCEARLLADVGLHPPQLSAYRCTQAMCRKAAIPESLAAAAEYLQLPVQKAKIGKELIKLFSDQTVRCTLSSNTVKTAKIYTYSPIHESLEMWGSWTTKIGGEQITLQTAWDLFLSYCVNDVRTEMSLHNTLKHFTLKGLDLSSFQMDGRMNHRGVPFNAKALTHTQTIIQDYQNRTGTTLKALCGLSASQTAKLLAWLRERGYPATNLQSSSVLEILKSPPEGMTQEAITALTCRAKLSFAAIKKIPAALQCVRPDGRVRGMKVWHGTRTGRGTSRLVQLDNVKKSTIKDSPVAYSLLCQGETMDLFEDLWESPLEAIASCMRHFIQLPNGEQMLDADYVGVEARIAPWLCGQEDKLQSILAGVDQYKLMAAEVVYNIPYDQVTKEQRTVGKPVELQLGYGAGAKGLRNSLRDIYSIVLGLDKCKEIVSNYRRKYSNFVQCWADLEAAVKTVILNPTVGKIKVAAGRITVSCGKTAGICYLVIQLPSGRRLYYPDPRVSTVFKPYDPEDLADDPSGYKAQSGGYEIESISFFGQYERKWSRIHTWGSRLFENCCQAIGADLLNYGMICAEEAGYDVLMCIHDQALAQTKTGTLEGYISALCQKQPWAETFPLAADGQIVPYYLKA